MDRLQLAILRANWTRHRPVGANNIQQEPLARGYILYLLDAASCEQVSCVRTRSGVHTMRALPSSDSSMHQRRGELSMVNRIVRWVFCVTSVDVCG